MPRARAKVGPQFRREDRIRINPITRGRDARNRGTLQMQFAAPSLKLDHEHLATGDYTAAAFAAALIVEGMPIVELVEITQHVELVLGQQL